MEEFTGSIPKLVFPEVVFFAVFFRDLCDLLCDLCGFFFAISAVKGFAAGACEKPLTAENAEKGREERREKPGWCGTRFLGKLSCFLPVSSA